jgi:hypothetical protein
MLAFLFSSADFNDAMRRMKYLKKFQGIPQAAGKARSGKPKTSFSIK